MGLSARAHQPFQSLLLIILVSCLVASCSSPPHKAPVTDVGQPPAIQLKEHVVAAGETLFSIAWRYDLDHRELARANGIGRDYVIYPGQRLNLDMSTPRATPQRTVARSQDVAPVSKPAPARQTAAPKRSKNQTPAVAAKPATPAPAAPSNWQWPVQGPLLASFHSNGGLNKGIDIGGKLGEPVLAAAAGNVVYSGSGLRGYGNLIIVKHNEKYLSAYAHNNALYVKEGDVVKAGQKIAEMGSSGTDRTKLHFEIRYDGKPVNPLKYLPRQ
jgi:lipoprotein NlpD